MSPVQCSSPTDTLQQGSLVPVLEARQNQEEIPFAALCFPLCCAHSQPSHLDHADVEVSIPAMEQFLLMAQKDLADDLAFRNTISETSVGFLVCSQGLPYLNIASLSHSTQR